MAGNACDPSVGIYLVLRGANHMIVLSVFCFFWVAQKGVGVESIDLHTHTTSDSLLPFFSDGENWKKAHVGRFNSIFAGSKVPRI